MIDVATATVESELDRYFAAARLRAGDYGDHYVELWDQLERASAGGKRARPALVLAAYCGLGGTDERVSTRLAIAFELLHTAFIIHDDVIDHDAVRRGAANVLGSFSARATAHGADAVQAQVWGEAAALLAGDLALSQAHRIVAMLEVDAQTRVRLLDLLDRAVFISAAGELSDVTNTVGAHAVGIPEVLATLEQKTAVYSCEAPLQAGAILAGATSEDTASLGRFGRLIGVAFQLTDDLLGVFGDEAVTGKSRLADLREGKVTTLLAHARTTAEWPSIAAYVGKPDLTEDEAELVRACLISCGSVAHTEQLARDHVALADAELSASGLPSELRQLLASFGDRAVNRSR
ncbi:MAG: polyprenyl synthetase family protein [Leifsonia sp.]